MLAVEVHEVEVEVPRVAALLVGIRKEALQQLPLRVGRRRYHHEYPARLGFHCHRSAKYSKNPCGMTMGASPIFTNPR